MRSQLFYEVANAIVAGKKGKLIHFCQSAVISEREIQLNIWCNTFVVFLKRNKQISLEKKKSKKFVFEKSPQIQF